MYDAAVSSIDAENVDAGGYDLLRRRKRVLSSVGFAEEERRSVVTTGGASSERCRRCFCSTDMRVMGDLLSWFTGIGAIDRTPTVVDV